MKERLHVGIPGEAPCETVSQIVGKARVQNRAVERKKDPRLRALHVSFEGGDYHREEILRADVVGLDGAALPLARRAVTEPEH